MGAEKSLLDYHGKPFIQHISESITNIFAHVQIIADEPSRFEFLRLPVLPDLYFHCGPLGGIHSALVHASTEKVFIVSCDTPLIQNEFIRFLLDEVSDEDVLVPSVGTFVHPLCGVYKKTSLPFIEERLKNKQYSVLQFIQTQTTKKVELTIRDADQFEISLRNVNTPEEYQTLISQS